MRPFRATCATAFCGAAWACSSFGAANAVSSADAGPDAHADAAADGGADAAPGPTSFCATKDASVCWSFDEPPYLPGPGLLLEATSGTIETTGVAPKSPPYALHVLTSGSPGAGFVGVVHQQARPSSRVVCTFDVRVESVGSGDIIITQLSGAAVPTTSTSILVSPSLGFSLAVQQGGVGASSPIGTYGVNTWLNVSLEVDAVKLVTNATVEGATGTLPLNADAGATLNAAYLGAAAPVLPSAWRLAFDNFFCTGF